MVLEKELEYFEKQRAELLKHHLGQFALVYEDELIGTFTKDLDAYAAGLQKVGNKPFLIKQILPETPADQLPAYTLGLLNANN